MEQHEKEIMDKIRQQTESIEIPEKLRPEMIEKKLTRKKRYRNYRYILAAAACMALLCVAYIQSRTGILGGLDKGNEVAEKIRENPGIRMAKSYEEVYEFVKEKRYFGWGTVFEEESNALLDGASSADTGSSDQKGSSGHSETNTREQGVDEGDKVKTDGRYLYVIKDEGNEIGIVDTAGDQLKEVSTITIDGCSYISEIYIKDQMLIVLYSLDNIIYDTQEDSLYQEMEKTCGGTHSVEDTKATVYNLSDVENPKETGSISQNGYYYTSRLNGDYLYTFSEYYVYDGSKEEEYRNYVPCVNGEVLSYEKICLPDVEKAQRYTVVTAINIYNPGEVLDSIGILSNAGMCYVSPEHIYICDYFYDTSDVTAIRKIAYRDGKMEGVAKAEVKGYLNDSFSIDEYDGYLRMVTSMSHRQSNNVYVLNEKLETVGKIEGLAEDERVYSARFMGDIGYFVTFRETDPLFSVDLSNPENPTIIGALKIPGFSEYLHPYAEGKLLGIGMEVDEKGVVADEVKLSMFDVSDPSNVTETDKCILEGTGGSMAFNEYKSVTIDAEKI